MDCIRCCFDRDSGFGSCCRDVFLPPRADEDIISNFKQTVEQLQEDDGEQEDRSDGKQTGQEAEKQDDNSILNDNNPGNKDWSEGDSYSRLNYPIDKEALRNDSLQYNESLKQNQNLLLKGTNYTYAALDLTKYGIYDNIYGYVSAPSIGLELPIYLGANDTTMSLGAGHLCSRSQRAERTPMWCLRGIRGISADGCLTAW